MKSSASRTTLRLHSSSTWSPPVISVERRDEVSTTIRNRPLPHVDFRTNRLILRRLTEEDWPEYLVIHADEEVMRFLGGRTDEASIRWRFEKLSSQYEEGTGHWAVVERDTGRLLGAAGLLRHDDWTASPYNVEVGWLIRRDAWGNGFATEAGAGAAAYAFADLGVERIICIVDPRNLASRRVAEKLGMELAGETVWREKDVVWYEFGRR